MHEGHALLGAGLADVTHLLGIGSARGGALDRKVVDDHADVAPVDAAEAGDLAVARRRGRLPVVVRGAEQAALEKAAGVDESVEPLLGAQLPLRLALGQLGGTTHAARLGATPVK